MKHDKYSKKMAKGQQLQDIQNVPVVNVQFINSGNSCPGMFLFLLPPYSTRPGLNGGTNTIRSHHIGKAPPGQPRAPGAARGHPPENKAGPPNQTIQEQIASPLSFAGAGPARLPSKQGVSHQTNFHNTNNPIFNTEKTINFINILNFKIMKKQILILVCLVLAAFANVNKSYGACITADPLHPLAGVPYDYSISNAGGTARTFQWFVTTSTDIVNGGALAGALAISGTTYAISNPTAATATITWAPELIALALAGTNNYYVVVKYVETNAAGCDMENIKAYKIKPVNSFQLDLANVDNVGDPSSGNVCTSDIKTAKITDNGTTATIVYDFDLTNIYVKVTVRNFTGAWNLSVNRAALIAAAAGAGESAKLFWGTTTAAATEITDANPVSIAEQNTADATTDEVIYLRLEVTHGTFEGLTAESFNFVVNATDKGGNPDVSALDCSNSLIDDQVTPTILARPTVVNTTVGGSYL